MKKTVKPRLLGVQILGNLVDGNDTRMAVLEVEPYMREGIPELPLAVKDNFGNISILFKTNPITYRWVGPLVKVSIVKCFDPFTKKEVSINFAKTKMKEWIRGTQ
jgi:hypothetical protein